MSWLKRNLKNKPTRKINSPKVVLIRQSLVGILIFSVLGLIGYGLWHFTRIDKLTLDQVEVVGGLIL